MDTKPLSIKPSSLQIQAHRVTSEEASISLQEWQGWGSTSPVPAMVNGVIEDLKLLEKDIDAHMTFDGNHGKLTVKIQTFLPTWYYIFYCLDEPIIVKFDFWIRSLYGFLI